MTLEEFKIKQKHYTAFAKYCSSRACTNDCPVLIEHNKNKKGCFMNFCILAESNILKIEK